MRKVLRIFLKKINVQNLIMIEKLIRARIINLVPISSDGQNGGIYKGDLFRNMVFVVF